MTLDQVLAAKHLLDDMSFPMFVVDADRKLRYANPAFREFIGLRPHEQNGLKSCDQCLGLSTCPGCCFSPEVLRTQATMTRAEITGRTAGGRDIRVNLTSTPLTDGNGTVVATLQHLLDVSVEERVHRKYRKSLEEEHLQRIQAQEIARELRKKVEELEKAHRELQELYGRMVPMERQATIGTMAGGIAHEINTPLQNIMGHDQMIRVMLDEIRRKGSITPAQLDRIEKGLRIIDANASRCGRISHGLLSYVAAPETVSGKMGNIIPVIEDAIRFFRIELVNRKVEVVREFPSTVPEFPMAAEMLIQSFLNVFINSSQAMKGVGKIIVTITVDTKESMMTVRVRDTGPGISKEIAEKMFEPFKTVRKAGQGTGLGLFLTRFIIRRHGGEIVHVPTDGEVGATFDITFPLETGL